MEEVNNKPVTTVTTAPNKSPISHVIDCFLPPSMASYRLSVLVLGSVVLSILSTLILRPDILPTEVVHLLGGKRSPVEQTTSTALFHAHFSGPAYTSLRDYRRPKPESGFLSWLEAYAGGREPTVDGDPDVPDTIAYPVQLKSSNTGIAVTTAHHLISAK